VIDQQTHQAMSSTLCGKPVELAEGRAIVALDTSADMVADERGLVHGGFVFGLADYAAMLAINHPNVVLGAASTKFLKPTIQGDRLVASATLTREEGKKKIVTVSVTCEHEPVFEGEFICFIPSKHVLD